LTNIYYFVPGTIAHPSDDVEPTEGEDSGAAEGEDSGANLKELHFNGNFNKLVIKQNHERPVKKVVIQYNKTE